MKASKLVRRVTTFVFVSSVGAFSMSAGAAESPDQPGERVTVHATIMQKKAWEWTIEERLAVRLDPVKIAERQSREDARYRAAGAPPPPGRSEGVRNYEIDGSRNPELLLPHELFQSLMTGFVRDGQRQKRQRESLRPGIIASGFDEELFWAKLRSAASRYIDDYAYPSSEATPSPSRGGSNRLCREAFLALNSARQVLGREQFDRFLYEVVAPATQVASATSAADPAAELNFVAGGCQ